MGDGTEDVMELEYPAEPRVISEIRRKFEAFVAPLGLPVEFLDDMKMAISEACGNAICHGSPQGSAARLRVRSALGEGKLMVEVADEGPGFLPKEMVLPEEEWRTSGRGLFLMGVLMDDVHFEASPTGTRVRLTKKLPSQLPSSQVGRAE
jgi:serine/threonine-protein kinase RsbW